MSHTHYQTLGITHHATSEQIKRAYRRLVKECHPDVSAHTTTSEEDRIRAINAAYAVLKDPRAREVYDGQIQTPVAPVGKPQNTVTDEAEAVYRWTQQVYTPLNRALHKVLRSLRPQLRALSADPFDPDLMDEFVAYLDECDTTLQRAMTTFRCCPNPGSMAGVASYLYYTLNHLEDGIEELRYFSMNFDDRHLHTGHELFRRASGLRTDAMTAMQSTYGH